jgi:hypothetical protein
VDPAALRKELQERGLVVLGVGQHHANSEVLTVYLHGLQGQWVDGYAASVIENVPGVLAVTESVQTPSILLVRVQPDPGASGERRSGD